MSRSTLQARSVGIGVVAALVGAAAVAGLLLVSGVYNVAASSEHFGITRLVLELALRRSVSTYSLFAPLPPVDLNDSNQIRLGAAHYRRGCAFCHGAPGEPANPVVEGMLPRPPILTEVVHHWSDKEIFRIVKHGLKYTGMPAWPTQRRDDEVWAVVAFLRQLPHMAPPEYRALAGAPKDAVTTASPPRAGDRPAIVSECARCHDDESSPPKSRFAPVLSGQTAEYLVHALANYAAGVRASGVMQPVAAELNGDERLRIAQYYAGLAKTEGLKAPAPPDQVDRGRAIALRGIAETGIPPCLACHSGNAAASFPLLSGQHAAYIERQLKLWKKGLRDRTAQGAIMGTIARRLSDEQIADLAAYFESRGPAEDRSGVEKQRTGASQ